MTEQAPPGWHPHPNREELIRYWDGERWSRAAIRTDLRVMAQDPTKVRGWDVDTYMTWGLIGTILGGAIFGAAVGEEGDFGWIGIVMLAVAQIFLIIGLVGKGVQVGMRAHRQDFGL